MVLEGAVRNGLVDQSLAPDVSALSTIEEFATDAAE